MKRNKDAPYVSPIVVVNLQTPGALLRGAQHERNRAIAKALRQLALEVDAKPDVVTRINARIVRRPDGEVEVDVTFEQPGSVGTMLS